MSTGNTEREFVEFVERYATRLYAVAVKYCSGNRLLAEDVLQGAFAKMWKAWPNKINRGEAILAWAHAVIRNTAFDFHRNVKRRLKGKDDIPVAEVPWDDEKGSQLASVTDTAEEAIFRAMTRDLWAAVAMLDEVQQDLLHLIYVDQLSLNAARKVLGLAGTTAGRYHEVALTRLREIIGDDI
ncbi:RNA polymerase sigma factor [Streptomyces sp. NPDC050523]|uniref:RNA polymerase sigma factor n=1 Tax=Streptomyces sp. NPDC050523 TaxID=3365622 RepID=UPI0037BC3011